MFNADWIKVLLIDHILSQRSPDLIVSEFAYLQGFRKADIVTFDDSVLTAYEIKSPRDSLDRLKNQISDYTSVFTYCYLVLTEKHLSAAQKVIPDRVGIIKVSENEITTLRTPRANKRLSKHHLSHSIPAVKMGQIVNRKVSNERSKNDFNVDRNQVEKTHTLNELKECFYTSTYEKYEPNYRRFLIDRGERTTLTDLYYLQSRQLINQ